MSFAGLVDGMTYDIPVADSYDRRNEMYTWPAWYVPAGMSYIPGTEHAIILLNPMSQDPSMLFVCEFIKVVSSIE